jgi:hypothetical protein
LGFADINGQGSIAVELIIGVLVLEVYTLTNQQLRFIMATHLLKYDNIKGSPQNLPHSDFLDKIKPIRRIEIVTVIFEIALFFIFICLSVTAASLFYAYDCKFNDFSAHDYNEESYE